MSEWISVNDRLPEDTFDFSCKDGLSRIRRYLCYCVPQKGDFTRSVIKLCNREVSLSGRARWSGIDKWHEVTHWMPLPDPPKDE